MENKSKAELKNIRHRRYKRKEKRAMFKNALKLKHRWALDKIRNYNN